MASVSGGEELVALLDKLQRRATGRTRPESGQTGKELDQPLDFRTCHASGQGDLRSKHGHPNGKIVRKVPCVAKPVRRAA